MGLEVDILEQSTKNEARRFTFFEELYTLSHANSH